MNTETRITLKEMARRLNRCAKTFRKYVVEYEIPHICLGRDMLFNAHEVENYLSNLTLMNSAESRQIQVSTAKKSKTKKGAKNSDKLRNKYANLLGLS